MRKRQKNKLTKMLYGELINKGPEFVPIALLLMGQVQIERTDFEPNPNPTETFSWPTWHVKIVGTPKVDPYYGKY